MGVKETKADRGPSASGLLTEVSVGKTSRKRAGMLADPLKLCPELKSARERMKNKENGEEITPQRSHTTTISAQETVADDSSESKRRFPGRENVGHVCAHVYL